ncbi:hypothetical protein H2200_005091 [Cladophialophora chaetospira]|uniref:Heterokaryon incompatibility domain-containing protein n=1 Tax=Cladophialophora chaetospira TaxID=386627 RepID=A0AA38XBF0_9EURO|nr:hypothetical protein H2200_005091 [Cladophialophora chaetospira]
MEIPQLNRPSLTRYRSGETQIAHRVDRGQYSASWPALPAEKLDTNYRSNPAIYERLSSADDIRLLYLIPGSGSDTIQCRLKRSSLATQPRYTAVSYTWGEPPAKCLILVNNQSILVRANVHRILQDLRHKEHVLTLWIDAICINQEDLEERAQAVQHMGEVYSSAINVVAWLENKKLDKSLNVGTELQDNEERAQAVQHMGEMYSSATKVVAWLENKMLDESLNELQVSSALLQPIQNIPGSVLRAFFAHEYWQRRWIIQEIARARDVTLCCGNYTAPLSHIIRLSAHFGRTCKDESAKASDVPLNHFGLTCKDESAKASNVPLNLWSIQKSKSKASLETLLRTYSGTKCSNVLDTVYALLPLSEVASQKFVISYSITLAHLLLATLEFCCHVEGLPSSSTIRFGVWLSRELEMDIDAFAPERGALFRSFDGLCDWERNLGVEKLLELESFLWVTGTVCANPHSHPPGIMSWGEGRSSSTRLVHYPTAMFSVEDVAAESTTHSLRRDGSVRDPIRWTPISYTHAADNAMSTFSWAQTHAASASGLRAGVATAPVREGDLLCRNSATPVVLVVRPSTNTGVHRIVARAFLVTSDSSSILEEAPMPHSGEVLWRVVTKGWETLDLIRLLDDSF